MDWTCCYIFTNRAICRRRFLQTKGYTGEEIRLEVKKYGIELETVKRREKKGFVLEARRWIVERTFAWLGKQRRLSKDYEYRTTTSENLIFVGMLKKTLRVIIYGK